MAKISSQQLKNGLRGTRTASAILRLDDAKVAASDSILSTPPGADARNTPAPAAASSDPKELLAQAVPGARLLLPLSLIRDGEHNPRAFYVDEARLEGLLESLARDGQLQDALVFRPDDAHPYFELKEGHRRKRCLEKLCRTHMSVLVVERPAVPLQAYRQAREVNKQRDNLSVFDDAVRFSALLQSQPDLRQEDFAREIGESAEYVSKVLKVSQLPMGVLTALAQAQASGHKVGLAMAYLIARFHDLWGPDKTVELVRKVVDERISVRQLERLLQGQKADNLPEGDAPAATRQRPTTRAELGGRLGKGEMKCFPDGRLELVLHARRHDFNGVMFRKMARLLKDCGFSVSA